MQLTPVMQPSSKGVVQFIRGVHHAASTSLRRIHGSGSQVGNVNHQAAAQNECWLLEGPPQAASVQLTLAHYFQMCP